MSERERAKNGPGEPRRLWRFGLIHLLLLPAALGLALLFIMGWYPYSVMMLPVLLVVLIVLVGSSVIFRPRLWWSSVEGLVVATVIYVLMTVIGPGFIDLREPARRSRCANNLKQILVALHNYHDWYGCFPPAYVAGRDGRPMHSWRVLILPFMEQQSLYGRYRFDEPWNGPNNSMLASARVWAYECPEQSAAGTSIMTSYVVVVGPGTAWPGATAARIEDIRDGTSNTLMVVEIADSGIHWMEPRDLDAATMAVSVNSKDGLGISGLHRHPGWQRQRLGANAGLADGSVLFLPTVMSEAKIRALLTAVGGEPVERDYNGRIQF